MHIVCKIILLDRRIKFSFRRIEKLLIVKKGRLAQSTYTLSKLLSVHNYTY